MRISDWSSDVCSSDLSNRRRPSVGQAIRFGIDLAKSVIQVHGVDARGNVVVRRQLRRDQVVKFFSKQPPALIGMEACGSAHYWGRELSGLGHDPRLERKSVVSGKSGSVRVDLGGRRNLKKKK